MSKDFRVVPSLYRLSRRRSVLDLDSDLDSDDEYEVTTRTVYTDVPRYRYGITNDVVVTPRPIYRPVYTSRAWTPTVIAPTVYTPRVYTARPRSRVVTERVRVRSASPRRIYYEY